jgi:FkbM family methyltransferase
MSGHLLKSAAKQLGLYPQLRRAHRALAPGRLRKFREECGVYRAFIAPGDLVFDVGANYGLKTEVFAALGARVVACEPQPECCDEIRARCPGVQVEQQAVGSAIGTATLYLDAHRTGSSLRRGWESTNEGVTLVTPVTTLDALIQAYGVPRFCKIDVEGFEREVFAGLHQSVPALSFEFHARELAAAIECLEGLRRLGSFAANFTAAEAATWYRSAWADEVAIIDWLREGTTDRRYAWGDVFVRFTGSGRG